MQGSAPRVVRPADGLVAALVPVAATRRTHLPLVEHIAINRLSAHLRVVQPDVEGELQTVVVLCAEVRVPAPLLHTVGLGVEVPAVGIRSLIAADATEPHSADTPPAIKTVATVDAAKRRKRAPLGSDISRPVPFSHLTHVVAYCIGIGSLHPRLSTTTVWPPLSRSHAVNQSSVPFA